jgi:Fe-S-cluster containining protein
MIRNVALEDISDGRLYSSRDMARVGCNDCNGCSNCCHVMGDSIVLDPLDVAWLATGLGVDFNALLGDGTVRLNVYDGVVLPYLNQESGGGGCTFLDGDGRCGIHGFRPGFCRMFPLGRYYEGDGFSYILQNRECPYPTKTKVRISSWLGIDRLSEYEGLMLRWHGIVKNIREYAGLAGDEALSSVNQGMLKMFYFVPGYGDDTYEWFSRQMDKWQAQ